MLEITLSYQDKQVALSQPGTKYGSNIKEFNDLVTLAFAGVGIAFEGTLTEMSDLPPIKNDTDML